MRDDTLLDQVPVVAPDDALEHLEEAAASIDAIREELDLRRAIGKSIRSAQRCLLQAQDLLEKEGPTTVAMLELVSASLWAGRAEQEMRRWARGGGAEPERSDLRAYPRVDVSRPVRLEPEVVVSTTHYLQAPIHGKTVNLSRGGVLARVDQGILQKGRYRVLFLDGNGRDKRASNWGTVRRSRFVDRGWEVGIEFEAPLDDLQLDGNDDEQ